MSIALSLAALPFSPLLLWQGNRVRRDTPVLPAASGPTEGVVQAPMAPTALPIRIIVIGESTVAGVGAGTHAFALTGCLAKAVAAERCQPVAWEAFGLSGATVESGSASLLPAIPTRERDLIVVAFGVNDCIAHTSGRAFAKRIARLVAAVRERSPRATPDAPPVPAIVCAAPPMDAFPALPQPLRAYLGARAKMLNDALKSTRIERAAHVATKVNIDRSLFASDGFHPSEKGYEVWGAEVGKVAAQLADLRVDETSMRDVTNEAATQTK
jgi:lysophospholipase L1-like esterase